VSFPQSKQSGTYVIEFYAEQPACSNAETACTDRDPWTRHCYFSSAIKSFRQFKDALSRTSINSSAIFSNRLPLTSEQYESTIERETAQEVTEQYLVKLKQETEWQCQVKLIIMEQEIEDYKKAALKEIRDLKHQLEEEASRTRQQRAEEERSLQDDYQNQVRTVANNLDNEYNHKRKMLEAEYITLKTDLNEKFLDFVSAIKHTSQFLTQVEGCCKDNTLEVRNFSLVLNALITTVERIQAPGAVTAPATSGDSLDPPHDGMILSTQPARRPLTGILLIYTSYF